MNKSAQCHIIDPNFNASLIGHHALNNITKYVSIVWGCNLRVHFFIVQHMEVWCLYKEVVC